MIAQVYPLKQLYQYVFILANIFYDFLGGYLVVIFPERKVIPFNGSWTGLTIFCITLYCPVKCQSKNRVCAIPICLILYDCIQILMEKDNKMVIYFYGSIYLVCFQNKRNMARKLWIFKNVLKHFNKTLLVKTGCWFYSEQYDYTAASFIVSNGISFSVHGWLNIGFLFKSLRMVILILKI